MKVPLLDLRAQYQTIRDDVRAAMDEVCDSQYFILGPKVEAFEEDVAAYCGTAGACGVSSGSDALIISLMVEGIGKGDEVITSSYTFFATAGAIDRVGATPVFVDIDPETFCLDAAQVADRVTAKTKAIIPVHLFGQTADMDPIMDIARQNDLLVIEDACQAIGAEQDGKRAGSIGDYGCFSFFPSKNLGGFGDGGMVTVQDTERLEQLKVFRNHGSKPRYYHHFIGGNFRLDALQAVVLSIKLKKLDDWSAARQKNAAEYEELFSNCAGADQIQTPKVASYASQHVFNQYTIRVPAEKRDTVMNALQAADVGAAIYYPVPLHLQPCFAPLGYKEGDLPESEAAARESLSIPIFPETTPEQRGFVVETISGALV